MLCTIVASMEEADLYIPKNSLLIAADKGYLHLKARGIEPHLTVGDFDSLGFVPDTGSIVRHPVRKDDTDMLLAVREGLRRGTDRFLLYGGMGGRLDHTLANIQTLAFLTKAGAKGLLFGDGTAVTLLQNGTIRFPASAQGTVSVFSFGGEAHGVTEQGLSFSLDEATVSDDFPIGVSNAFAGAEGRITVRDGRLLILWTTGAEEAAAVLLQKLN